MRSDRFALPVLLAVALLTGCAAPQSGVEPETVSEIPASWLEVTAADWPSSDGFGGSMPVLSYGKCLLSGVPPTLFGTVGEHSSAGWGPYGADSRDAGAYRYLCDFWLAGRYAGQAQVLQAPNAVVADSTVREFLNQPSTEVQDNAVTTVQSGQLEVHVLTRWYPTNPQGEYQALYFDEPANAIVVLEVNSLTQEDFDAYSPQQLADDLVAMLAAAS